MEVLSMQTELLSEWDGTDRDMERIQLEIETNRPPQRFGVIYNCPFSGFINAERTRVGCLLHPRLHGEDMREYCRYGKRTCGEAKCQAYTYLNEGEARAIMASAPDWYIYGLDISDNDLVRDFFELAEMKTNKASKKLKKLCMEVNGSRESNLIPLRRDNLILVPGAAPPPWAGIARACANAPGV